MYHGDHVPGFPQHPHRGFETITLVRRGMCDHSDSLGAAARFGEGDVQWVTAGSGIVHSEMFPLLRADRPNPLELFQIWLNLPAADKMADPHFTMLWADEIPRVESVDVDGRTTVVTVVAGAVGGAEPPAPPPESWAARAETDVAVWVVTMEPGARWTLPAAAGAAAGGVGADGSSPGTLRVLYPFEGPSLVVDGEQVPAGHGALVRCDRDVELVAGDGTGADGPLECLVLQGRPIAEPVARYGPFVMTTREEIVQAFDDYRATEFGGWPWAEDGPAHGDEPERFARFPDGREARPGR